MKSYFADSIQVAMERARKELGEDAVLVTSRTSSVEARSLGQYEVVFATEVPDPSDVAGPNSEAPRPAPVSPTSRAALDSIANELRDLRRQFQAWRQHSLRCSDQPRWVAANPQLESLLGQMSEAEVDRDLALRLLAAAETHLRPASDPSSGEPISNLRIALQRKAARRDTPLDAASLRLMLAAKLRQEFRVDSSIARVTALVGPPGVGKTATVAKLAVKYGLTCTKPAMLISYDTMRVAACEQLRTYASILGIGFEAVDTNRALAQVLEEHRSKDLILIDTPGFSFGDLDGARETAEYLALRTDIQKQLVLPATLRAGDLARYSAAYAGFRPSHLVFTRLDETQVVGPLVSEAVRCGLPISFLGVGQRVPEDLELADSAALVNRVLPVAGGADSVASAA